MNAIDPGATASDAVQAASKEASGGLSFLQRVRRLLRYTGVNLVTVTIDYAIFLSITHYYATPTLASIAGYSCALAINYELSRRFVFLAHLSEMSARRLMTLFLVTSLFGLVLTAAITGLSVHYLHLSPLLSKTIAVLVCFVVLYVVRTRLVFK